MTNVVIQFLHTTAAYQTAVAQLLIGEANFAASRLSLPEWQPIQGTNQVQWEVAAPPLGVGGAIITSNYAFTFERGRLIWINRQRKADGPNPAWRSLQELVGVRSRVDTNGAYQLATQWLAAIGVDLRRLEAKHPWRAMQIPARDTNAPANEKRLLPTPLFRFAWTTNQNRILSPFSPVFLELRGDTKELWSLHIRDRTLFAPAPLRLTNTAELLGPLPPPRKFVEDVLGGRDAYETVATPARVEASLIEPPQLGTNKEPETRRGPVQVKGKTAERLSSSLLNFESYQWGAQKLCLPQYGARLRFVRDRSQVDILLCFECDILLINGKNSENFDFAHNELLRALKGIFPRDSALAQVDVEESTWKEYCAEMEKIIQRYETTGE